jgi:hypothetical protein
VLRTGKMVTLHPSKGGAALTDVNGRLLLSKSGTY